jgi:hypothetical protein
MSTLLESLCGAERRAECSKWDSPVTDRELDAFYGEPLSDIAIAIGEQHILADMDLLSDFVARASTEREPSKFFGTISTCELVQLTFGENAPEKQRSEAAIEFRTRFLKYHEALVFKRAREVSYA